MSEMKGVRGSYATSSKILLSKTVLCIIMRFVSILL